MKDLEEHLKSLESFSKGRGRQYGGLLERHGEQPWNDEQQDMAPWMPKVQQVIEFLQNSGANPNVVQLREGRKGPVIGVRLRSIDGEGLSAYLKSLGSARAVAQWVEDGVGLGAVSVRGERVFVVAQPHHNGTEIMGSPGERGVDCTDTLTAVAHQLMESEVAPTLESINNAKESGGGDIVRFRADVDEGQRQVLQQPAANQSVAKLKRKSPGMRALADGNDLGEDPKFVVSGPAVETANGRFIPVRAVDARSRRVLSQMGADGVHVGRGGVQTFVRAELTESVDLSSDMAAHQAEPVGLEGDADGGRRRGVAMAYNLLHGMTLAAGEGKPLEAGVAARMERFFGSRFGDVKIHSGRLATEVTEALSVEAVSVGSHVIIPQQLLNKADGRGERVLVHELTHVRQHQSGSEETRSRKELDADQAVNQFMSGRRYSPVVTAQMSTRAPAPAPATSGAMPMNVYASAQRKVDLAERSHKKKGPSKDLRNERNIRRIVEGITTRDRSSLEDQFDRKG